MLTFIKIVTVFITTVSACTTWDGFRSAGHLSFSYFGREIMPVLMGSASLLISVALWFILFDWYPKSNKDTRRKLNWATGIGCIIIFFLSTNWSVICLGGDAALIHHMNLTVGEAERMLNGLITQIESEVGLQTSADLLTAQFRNLAGMETEGAFTSFAGKGEVVAQLVSLSHTFGNLSDTVGKGIKSRRQWVHDAKEEIGGLREIINSAELEQTSKIREFGKRSTSINQLFQKINGSQTAVLVKEASGVLDKLAATQQPTGNGQLASAQREVLSRLEQTTQSAKKIMSKFSQDSTLASPELKPLMSIHVGNAVWKYAHVITWAWAGAIALDYMPLVFGLMLFWTTYHEEEKQQTEELGMGEREPDTIWEMKKNIGE